MACRLTRLTWDEDEKTVEDFTDLRNLPLNRWWCNGANGEPVITKTRAVPLPVEAGWIPRRWPEHDRKKVDFRIRFGQLLKVLLSPSCPMPDDSNVVRVAFVFFCGHAGNRNQIRDNIDRLLSDREYESNFDWMSDVHMFTSPDVLCITMSLLEIDDSITAMPRLRPADDETQHMQAVVWPPRDPSRYVWERLGDLTLHT